jgi:tetratricopeptide (TPR) repeat protein
MEEGWIDKVISLYERCIELGRGHIDNSKNAELLSDYADFLFYQHLYNKVETVYKEALSVYRKLNQSSDIDYEPCVIYCLKQLSLYYIYSNEYQNAENALNEILLSQKEDGEEDEQLRYADAITRLSYLHYNQLQFRKALEECDKAISIYSRFEWYYELSESIYLRGIIHKDMGANDLAEKDALEMIDYVKKDDPNRQSSAAYNLLGNVYNNQLKYDQAINAYLKAQNILEEKSRNNPQPYIQEMAGNYNNLGRMYRLKDMYDVAYDNFNKAISLLRTLIVQDPIQNSETYIRCLYSLSDLCKELKKYIEAEAYIDEAIKYSRNLVKTDAEKHLFDLAHSLNIKGIILYEQKKYQEAEDSYLESLNIRKRIVKDLGDQYLDRVAQILSNLGLLHCEIREYENAEKEYLEATNIYKSIISKSGLSKGGDICYTLLNLGYLSRCNKKWNKAIEYYQESINILKKTFDEGIVREKNIAWSLISRNLVGIGYSYRALNDYEKAIGNFKEAVDVINEHINKENKIVFAPDYAIALNEYAWSLYERNECLSAEPYSEKSVDTIRLLPDNKNALRMYLDTLACIHRELGKYSEAEKEFIECLGIAEELYNQNADLNLPGLYNELKELSFLYYKVKDIDKFNQYKTKALQYYNKLSEEEKINREEDLKKLESLVIT